VKKSTRREFLGNSVLGTVGAGLVLAGFPLEDLLATQARKTGGYAANKLALFLDGAMAGWVYSAEGGHATGDAVAGQFQKKAPGGVKYEDITLSCGTGMSRGFYDWITATTGGKQLRKNGAIVVCDYDFKEVSRLEFNDALITEIGFPELDAASKDAAKMTIKFSPEFTRSIEKSGAALVGAVIPEMQKKWLPSNFRLQIGELNCTRVSKIEAITVKQKLAENPLAGARAYGNQSATLAKPALSITIPEADAPAFLAWQKQAVSGNLSGVKKNGRLDYLAPDLREALFTLRFMSLIIAGITEDRSPARYENVRRFRVQMYYEGLEFSSGAA